MYSIVCSESFHFRESVIAVMPETPYVRVDTDLKLRVQLR